MLNLPETSTWWKAEQSPVVPWGLATFPKCYVPCCLSWLTYISSLRLPENKFAVLQQRIQFSLLLGFISIPEDA